MMIFPSLLLVTTSLVGGAFGWFGFSQLSQGLPFVDQKLLSMESSNIMISMKENTLGVLGDFDGSSSSSRSERATQLTRALKSFSEISQEPALAVLKAMGVKAESLWITNQIFVKDANPGIVKALMSIPSILAILEEILVPFPDIFNIAFGKEPNGTEWNVKIVDAPKVWEDGNTGEGILVGGIDTGVRASHSTLRDNYVGKHGWHDPALFSSYPNDVQGHGTHTMATSVGSKGVGIAPGAKWMACRGCVHMSCQQHTLLACGQFMVCPSAPRSGKKKAECEGIPHVINNSWGGGGGETWFDPVILAWLKVGIKPIFANGNSGPKCETGGSPADNNDVIAVGSTNKDDKLSKYSSRGPQVRYENATDTNTKEEPMFLPLVTSIFSPTRKKITTKTIKPNICAPGENVNSAGFLTDNSYKVMSGTSMAAPAATGVAALILSKNPKLTLKKLKKYLYGNTDKDLDLTPESDKATQCGPIPADKYPNHMCGHGRVNAWKAYEKLKKDMEANGEGGDDEDGEGKGKKKGSGRKMGKSDGKKKRKEKKKKE